MGRYLILLIEKLARNNLDKRIRYINGIYDSNVYDILSPDISFRLLKETNSNL